MKSNIKWVYLLPMIIVVGIIVGITSSHTYFLRKRLKENGKKTMGKITNVTSGFRGGHTVIEYQFLDNNQITIYSNSQHDALLRNRVFIGKVFPVIYNPGNSNENEIIIGRKTFEEFNIYFPDSLDWVEKYER